MGPVVLMEDIRQDHGELLENFKQKNDTVKIVF